MVCSSWVCHWIGNRLSSWCPDSLTPTCTSLSGTSIGNVFICCLNIVVGIYLPMLECWIAQQFLFFFFFELLTVRGRKTYLYFSEFFLSCFFVDLLDGECRCLQPSDLLLLSLGLGGNCPSCGKEACLMSMTKHAK